MIGNIVEFRVKKKELIIICFIIAVYLLHRLFMYKLGLYMEECRDANAMLMVLNGKVPYRDFHFWVYGPFVFCIYPLIFKIFGVSLGIFRLSFIIAGAFVIPLVYLLSRRLMSPIWAGVSAFLSIILLDVPYYTYNHIFATLAGLLALLFVIKFMEEGLVHYVFFSGIFIGIALLVKPFFMGFGMLFSIGLFMCFLEFQNHPVRKIKYSHIVIFLAGALLVLVSCAIYFIIHGSLYKFLRNIIPLGADRVGSFYVYTGFTFSLRHHLKWLMSLFPIKIFFSPLSLWKEIIVKSYYAQLLYSPVLVPLIIVVLNKYIFYKYNLVSKISVRYLVLFTIFSIFIAGQSLIIFGLMGRSFTMQIPFLLIAYFLSLVNNKKLYAQANFRKHIIVGLSICFIFYLSFLHVIRYPYSKSKKYTVPLNFERAKNIKVTYEEKELYEALNKSLYENTNINEPIAVIGYYPQFAFLFNRENIFGDMEDVFIKFSETQESNKFDTKDLENVKKTEDYLISRLKLRKPKFIISPVSNRKYLTPELIKYINQSYVLEKTFGPADLDIYTTGIVRLYKRREGNR